MAEIISGALTTSENDSTTETKGIELVIEHVVDELLGLSHDWELEDVSDEYVRWVNFGVGGPA